MTTPGNNRATDPHAAFTAQLDAINHCPSWCPHTHTAEPAGWRDLPADCLDWIRKDPAWLAWHLMHRGELWRHTFPGLGGNGVTMRISAEQHIDQPGPVLIIDSDGEEPALTLDESRQLAAALTDAADRLEDNASAHYCGCGKPADHVNAHPDSPDWACRVPEINNRRPARDDR